MAERINNEAKDPDFIKAYCLVIGEGPEPVSACGHAALRLTCQSKGLDYCFTFEMNLRESGLFDVLTRSAKAGFVHVPTQNYLRQFHEEGRGVKQYELNLSPGQKQKLWRTLDEQVGKGSQWTFDLESINCVSMTNYVISTAVQPSRITYGNRREKMLDRNDKQIRQALGCAPWYISLAARFLLLGINNDKKHSEDFMLPAVYGENMASMRVVDESGIEHPMTKGPPRTLVRQVYVSSPQWDSLVLLVVLLAIVALLLTWAYQKRKKIISLNKRKDKK